MIRYQLNLNSEIANKEPFIADLLLINCRVKANEMFLLIFLKGLKCLKKMTIFAINEVKLSFFKYSNASLRSLPTASRIS